MDIEIEDQESWPEEFLNAISKNKGVILSYHQEQRRIDDLCEKDVLLRTNAPINRYKQTYQDFVRSLETILNPNRIVAFHCTRLTPEEILQIKSAGLTILSRKLVQQRLNECLFHGHINKPEHDYLTKSENVKSNLNNQHGKRTGIIWFCPNRSTLQESSGVYRLFRSWGGEAIYVGHEDDEAISDTLCRIGAPCIVKCGIQFSYAEQFHSNFSERFISQFVLDEIEFVDPPARFDMKTRRDVPASNILEVIEFSNPKFEALTAYKNWDNHYQINSSD